jgi:Tfp pilus assembly protein PilN
VNLMPPEIAEAARFRRFQLAMGATVLAAVAIVGALYVHAQSSVADAQSDLDAAKAEGTNLSTQISSLSSVQDVYTRVAARQAMLTTAMGHEIRWSYYLTDLSLKVPDNVWLTDMHATQSSTGLGAPGVPVPAVGAAPTSVASIEFQGVAFKHVDVATWLDALAKERGFTNPYFTN